MTVPGQDFMSPDLLSDLGQPVVNSARSIEDQPFRFMRIAVIQLLHHASSKSTAGCFAAALL
jgi:hypothetical protein